MRVISDNDRVKVWSDLELQCKITKMKKNSENGSFCTEFWFAGKKLKQMNGKIRLEFSFPIKDICGRWFPVCKFDRSIKADYDAKVESMTASSAPVVCFYNANSENRYTIALSEVCQKTIIKCGIHEEDGTMLCVVEFPLMQKSSDCDWKLILWESWEQKPYWDVLDEVRIWWEQTIKIIPAKVPNVAKKPMYSFWYSKHQNVTAANVEEESRLAADMGFSAIIVDDGWQTEDNQRGYAFCGDWKPSKEKFPNFAEHVSRVQKMGVKYLLWFSVPYIGKKSLAWETFHDKILRYNEDQQAGIFDLRYPEVRKYLKDIYVQAVKEWNLDGLKLDFIDEFYFDENSPEYNKNMDCYDIQEALNIFLTDVMETLRLIRPDILIEFRQRYIGPQVRKYGNILRVSDCPGSAISNRVGTIDLRLLSGNTAVHSDMLMWNEEEKTEEAALQMLSCLFATVQISVSLDNITDKMKQMLLFQMDFMRKNEKLLLESKIQPYEPENLYPEVHSEYGEEELWVHYSSNRIVDLRTKKKKCCYVHAVKAGEVCIRCRKEDHISYEILDCCGINIEHELIHKKEWVSLWVPTAGIVIFKKEE